MPDPAAPQIIVAYSSSQEESFHQDIVVYLRPETNGIRAESVMFRVLKTPSWKDSVKLVYLANLPGAFLLKNRVIENHYSTRVDFARQGPVAFTKEMQDTFQRFFGIPFEKAKIKGAFEACTVLNKTPEELFQLWVPVYDILEIEGQLIKRTADNLFVVNYDIPAILEKNHAGTDVAAMVFRTSQSYDEFKPVVEEIRQSLIQEKILDPEKPERRVFHYSKGPFEQLLDAQGYVYRDAGHSLELDETAFGRYLLRQGFGEPEISAALKNPIFQFDVGDGKIQEKNLFSYTLFDSFEAALAKWRQRRISQ